MTEGRRKDVAMTKSGEATVFRPSPSVLTGEAIRKSYRRGLWSRHATTVLRGADVVLRPGEVVGLVGENGSGKTTLMRILSGDVAPDSGHVTIDGSTGYCPQTAVLYDRLTCAEHFELFAAAYGLADARAAAAASALYEQLDFARFADTRASELSGGTRSKLNLALALLHDPQILFLDEPYAGFDWDTYTRFWEIAAERRSTGASALIVSHFIADQDRFDRIYDLVDGETHER